MLLCLTILKWFLDITVWFDRKNEGKTRVNRFTRISQLGQLINFSEKTVTFYICAREAGSARERSVHRGGPVHAAQLQMLLKYS